MRRFIIEIRISRKAGKSAGNSVMDLMSIFCYHRSNKEGLIRRIKCGIVSQSFYRIGGDEFGRLIVEFVPTWDYNIFCSLLSLFRMRKP